MNSSSRRSKTTVELSASTQQRLNMYAMAAGAAGVGVLALAQPTEAKIVYTPANIRIVQNGGLITFDLNHDGIPDFSLSNKYTVSESNFSIWVLKAVQARPANEIEEGQPCGETWSCAAALPEGAKIGVKGQFQRDPTSGVHMLQLARCDSCYNSGPWLYLTVPQAYLGLKFVIRGKTHFGWARVKVSHPIQGFFGPIQATLTGYAYETVPNKPIIAGETKGPDGDVENNNSGASLTNPIQDIPQTTTLGALAVGAPGLSIWRREDPVAATSDRTDLT